MKLWTEQDIIALILSGEERPDFDYKDDLDLTASRKAKAEMAKDVIAMANSGGGLIVGGVRETSKGYVWKGMSQAALETFDSTALNDFVKSYCAPPINATTRKVEIDGKLYGVIIVPEFADQPHIVVRDYPEVFKTGDFLVRSASNNSLRAGPDELRKLINLAVRRRQGALKNMLQAALENRRPTLIGAATSSAESVGAPFDRSKYADTYKGFRIVTIAPVEAQVSVRPMELRGAIEQAIVIDHSGYQDFPPTYFSRAVEKRLPVGIAFEQESESRHRLSFAFFGVYGEVFCADSLWEDNRQDVQDIESIGLFSTIKMMFEAVLFARRYYPALGHEGTVAVRYSQESSVPRVLEMDSRDHWPLHSQYYNDLAIPVAVERTIRTDANLESLEEVTKDMMIEFFWYFHFDFARESATPFLEYLKEKRVRIPRDVLSELKNTGGHN
jgi:hypothetical protein